VPRSSFTRGFIIGGLLVGGALALAAWGGALKFLADWFTDDEERPPIIVNNNSIDLRALPLKGSTGTWLDKTNHLYWHDYGAKRGANFFTVSLLVGVDACKDQANNPDSKRTFEKLEGFELFYSDAGPKSVLIDATKYGRDRYVQVNAENATKASITGDLLKIGADNVTIQSIKLSTNKTQWTECTFTGSLQLLMAHPTKD
jgi:hypothetical protein